MAVNMKLDLLLQLPTELIGVIAGHLDLAGVKSLRLTCKTLREKTLPTWLKKYIERHSTTLSSESLRELGALAVHPDCGKAVKTLDIIALVYDVSMVQEMLRTKTRAVHESQGLFQSVSYPKCTEEELAEAQADQDWLQARNAERDTFWPGGAIEQLAVALQSFGTIETINLTACVVQSRASILPLRETREWVPVWTVAAQVYDITMAAIAQSQVRAESLMIYRDNPFCSVSSFSVTTQLERLDVQAFAEAGKHIKDLALNMSSRVPTDALLVRDAVAGLEGVERLQHEIGGSATGLYSSDSPEARAEENFTGVPRLLQLLPNLEALDLHMRNLLKHGETRPPADQDIFARISRQVHLPSLHQVFIRGLTVTEAGFLEFLRKHPKLDFIYLQHVHLQDGTWLPIFEEFSKMPSLRELHVANLWAGRIVNLDPVDPSIGLSDGARSRSYPCGGGPLVHTNFFTADDIQKGLQFKPDPPGLPKGSPQLHNWRLRQREFLAPGWA